MVLALNLIGRKSSPGFRRARRIDEDIRRLGAINFWGVVKGSLVAIAHLRKTVPLSLEAEVRHCRNREAALDLDSLMGKP